MIKKLVQRLHNCSLKEESGQALILVLILLVVGSLALVPALEVSRTALKTGMEYEEHSQEVYTADAGIEDGLWRIKYNYFGTTYDAYDFSTAWDYETETVNGSTASVSIQNVWVPTNVTLAGLGLSKEDARDIIESEVMIVTGSPGAVPGQPFNIKLDYTPVTAENLVIKSIGVWLPQGFTYTAGTGTPETADPLNDPYYTVPVVTACDGGSSVVWTYSYPYPAFTSFPGVDINESTMTAELSFSYSPPDSKPNALPTGVAWITTELDDGTASDYPVVWDACNRVFSLTSSSGATLIEAYSSKSEMRRLGGAIQGEYVAIGNSLMLDNYYPYDKRDTLLSESATSITDIPADADVIDAYLYWTGWRDSSSIIPVLAHNTSLWSTADPTDWTADDGVLYGHHTDSSEEARLLTLATALDLSSYVPGSILLSWEQESLGEVFSDVCTTYDNWTNGAAWTIGNQYYYYFWFKGQASSGSDAEFLTMSEPIDLSGSTDTVTIGWEQSKYGTLSTSDKLYFAFSGDGGTTWSDNFLAFEGNDPEFNFSYDIPETYLTSQFLVRFELAGFTSPRYCKIDNITISSPLTSSDGLDYAISSDGGSTWSDNMEAFRGETDEEFVYYLPASYTTSTFKLRFETVGMTGPGHQAVLDNIQVRCLPPDNSVVFEIDGEQVYLDSSGDPQTGEFDLTASDASVILTTAGASGFTYACSRRVNKLVETYPVVESEEHHTGNAEYTVGGVTASTGEYLSHAGWSLIVVYTSPGSAGHYLYLRDYFAHNPGSTNLDFDFDGTAGGSITNFTIPEPIKDKAGNVIESVAARITCFIGEGDSNYSGDYLSITGQQSGISSYLYNSASPWNNVWNGASPDMSYPGVDVDTFEVLWSDNVLLPADTSLHLDMVSGTDAWNFIYLILSVRSETVVGGTSHYVINRN